MYRHKRSMQFESFFKFAFVIMDQRTTVGYFRLKCISNDGSRESMNGRGLRVISELLRRSRYRKHVGTSNFQFFIKNKFSIKIEKKNGTNKQIGIPIPTNGKISREIK